ncbi:hypothetical protein [Cupriavidus metallidurans]|uniref:hypothetical protein n=1 Tax=Cupriavidus metallidurans TaxID=119219 RepID=UPI001D130ADB|nr:hypothetical protein [Cupriavidus metallidurans]
MDSLIRHHLFEKPQSFTGLRLFVLARWNGAADEGEAEVLLHVPDRGLGQLAGAGNATRVALDQRQSGQAGGHENYQQGGRPSATGYGGTPLEALSK